MNQWFRNVKKITSWGFKSMIENKKLIALKAIFWN